MRSPPVALFTLASTLVISCASPKVARKSEAPQRKEVPGQGNFAWEPKAGWVQPTRGKWGPPSQVRAEAREAFDAGVYADALTGFLAYQAMAPPDDPSAAETTFFIAECYYQLGNYEKAIEHYREVYQKHKPDPETLQRSFERVHTIALQYLRGEAVCSFLIIDYKCPGHGIELLVGEDGLITQYPHLSFADDAIYEIGKHYFERKEYPEAVPVYERLIRDYPQSEWRSLAEYHLALATFKQMRGVDYDEKVIEDAERKFLSYLKNNPRGPQAEDARQKLEEIRNMLGEKNLRLAKFYLRESEPVAARIYLRIVLERYTSSAAAREAREIQRQLEK